jgi:hypothetical protein
VGRQIASLSKALMPIKRAEEYARFASCYQANNGKPHPRLFHNQSKVLVGDGQARRNLFVLEFYPLSALLRHSLLQGLFFY